MYWLTEPWVQWLSFLGLPAPWSWSHDEALPASRPIFGQFPALTALDLRLIELTYEVVAAESNASGAVPRSVAGSAWCNRPLITRHCGLYLS